MHISEGVVDVRLCVGGYVCAAGLVAVALRKIKPEDIPKISLMGAAFFASSLIHFKVGITSVHLTLIGLTGIILGTSSVAALGAGLFFQAVMFQHGGLSTLGINTVLFALPALAAHGGWRVMGRLFGRGHRHLLASGAALLAALSLIAAALSAMLTIRFSGEAFAGFAWLFSASHALLAGVEGLVTFLVVDRLLTVKPDMLQGTREETPRS